MEYCMTLHQDTNTFRQLILLTAQHLNMRPSYVEKDYWVTQMLYHLAQSPYADSVVFKGGTSLSKGYNLINRFSEDVDVAVIHENLTGNAVKTLIRNVEKGIIGEFTPTDDPANSKGSMYRKSVLTYPVIMQDEPGAIQVRRMILEISAFANPFPYECREVCSLISQYLHDIDREDVVARYEMGSFVLNVLDYRRTLVEKMVSLIRFSFGETHELASKIRHFYDLYYLMQTQGCQDYVASMDFQNDLLSLLRHDRQAFDTPDNWGTKLQHGIPLVTHFDDVWEKLIPTYQAEMNSLSFSQIPSPIAVGKVVKVLFDKISNRL